MNLKTGLAALAIATAPLSVQAQKTAKTIAKNDSIVQVVKQTAQKADTLGMTAFSDAQKALVRARKAPKGYVTVTKTSGKFVGKVGPQGLNGDLVYTSSSRMVVDPAAKKKTSVSYGVNYLHTNNLPKGAAEMNAEVTKGGVAVKAQTYLGKSENDVSGGLKLKGSYNYDLGSGFTAGPQVGLHTNLSKVKNDAKGAFAPEIAARGTFNHEFESGVKVGAEVTGGAAARLGYNNRATDVSKITETYNAAARVGYKDVAVEVSGGKDVHLGNHVMAGLKYNF